MAKKGRKSKPPYRDANGNDHPGLYRKKNGRFAASGYPNKTFGTDETDAIRRFYEWQSRLRGATVTISQPMTDLDQFESAIRGGSEIVTGPNGSMPNGATINHRIDEAAYWARVTNDLRKRPKLVARKTGIEQVGYLTDLDKPAAPLALAEIGELYFGENGKASKDTKGRAKLAWSQFCEAVKPATTVPDITGEHLRAYERKVRTATYVDKKTKKRRKYDEKTVSHRFNLVGSILREAWLIRKDHRAAIHELQIEFRQFCKNNHNREGNPTPIDVEDFHALYQTANVKWRAVLLCMMNFATHPNETIQLKRRHLDMQKKTYDDKRKKRGHYRRVAVIMDETIAAIRAYQETQKDNPAYQESEYLFLTDDGKPYSPDRGATEYYRETLRPQTEKRIGRKLTVTLDSIRDGAQNAADDGGADPLHTMMLMGHGLPGTTVGAYKNRLPYKTAKSVECIREHYGIAELVSNGD